MATDFPALRGSKSAREPKGRRDMPIRLPQDAHGYDYEDQICALLLAPGFYLETRLILKKGAGDH